MRNNNKHQSIFLLFLSLAGAIGCSDFGPELERPEERSYPSDIQAAWSPDGQLIVYRHEDYSKYDSTYPNGLYLIDPNGNNKRLLLEGEAAVPAWSPDGQWIAYTDGHGPIYAMNVQTRNQRRLTSFIAFYPTWSPDGARIACARSGTQDVVGIWIVNVQDTTAIRWRFQGGIQPHWSPSGHKFLFAAPPNPYTTYQISSASIDDSLDRKILTRNTYSNRDPKWSFSGSIITWTLLVKTKGEVWIMNSDGSGQRRLIDGSHPYFSPDSRTIAFSTFDPSGDKIVLWSVALDGSGLRQLTY